VYQVFQTLPNVTLYGRLNASETLERISQAKVLINTSDFEGFPNVFLEAWSFGVPVVSLNVDPGGVIQENHLGVVCNGDLRKMISSLEQIDSMVFDPIRLQDYVMKNHSLEAASQQLAEILPGLVALKKEQSHNIRSSQGA